ncbi:MAG: hypothetical protein ACYTFY_19550 [Planctomycetota bacterium]|jgi:hypothetical protein
MTEFMQKNRFVIFGLSYNCPFSKCNDDCPLKELRELSAEEREKVINQMTPEEILKVMNYHQVCSKD